MAQTKVTGGLLSTTSNYEVGVITATKFVGPFGGTSDRGAGYFSSLDVTGDVNIGGTLSYVDVDNITATGIITAQDSVQIGAGLSVAGVSTFTSSVGIADSIIHLGNTDTSIRFPAADQFAVDIAGTRKFFINASGKVGIGTDNVWEPLDVYGNFVIGARDTSDAQISVGRTDAGNRNAYIDLIGDNTYSDYGLRLIRQNTGPNAASSLSHRGTGTLEIAALEAAPISIKNGGNSRLYIKTTGEVGIGSESPQSKLTLAAASGDTIFEFQRTNTNTNGAVGVLNFTALDGHSVANIQVRGDGNDEGGAIQFRTTSAAASNDPYASPHNGLIAMQIKSDGQTVLDGSASQTVNYPIQINNSAAAGNGTTPDLTAIAFASGASTKASIQAAVYGEGWMSFHNNNNTEKMRLDANGRLGIGTITPGRDLHLWNATEANLKIEGGADYAELRVKDSDDAFGLHLNFAGGGSSEVIHITSDHRIGINDNSPNDYELDIMKRSAATDAQMRLYNNATGSSNDTIIRSQINGTTASNYLYFGDSGDSNVGQIRYSHNTDAMTFNAAAAEVLKLDSTGATVTGEVAATQDYPNIRPRLDLNFKSVNKLDSRLTYYRSGSASYTDKNGIVKLVGANVPRFDHDPMTGECKGLLIETSSTNYVRQGLTLASEWVSGSGSKGVDYTITNPDGSVGAWYHTGGELYHQNIDLSGASTNEITISMWVKEKSGQSGTVDIQIYQQISGSVVDLGACNFNPTTGVLGTADANFSNGTVTQYPNGWYRFSATVTTGSGNFSSSTRFDMQNKEHYVWGMQLEAGSKLSSFIPTKGTVAGTAPESRGYEYLSMEGSDASDLFNEVEGTLFAEWIATESETNQNLVSFHRNLASGERVELRATASNTAKVRFEVVTGSSSVVSDSSISHGGIGDNTKAAFGFKKDDYAYSVNGSAVATDSSGNMPSDINSLMIGRATWGTSWFDGYVKRILYYPKRLPNSQLITITS